MRDSRNQRAQNGARSGNPGVIAKGGAILSTLISGKKGNPHGIIPMVESLKIHVNPKESKEIHGNPGKTMTNHEKP